MCIKRLLSQHNDVNMSNDVQEQELGAEVVTNATSASVDDGLESMRCKFENLCRDLNMDRQTEDEAFDMLNKVLQHYSLEVSTT